MNTIETQISKMVQFGGTRFVYNHLCSLIRRSIQLNCTTPHWQLAKDVQKQCQLWQELTPTIYEKAQTSVYNSPTFD